MIDVSRFDTFYDPIMAYSASLGLTIHLSLGYNNVEDIDGPDANKRYARYLVARYGAYPVVWSAAKTG